MDRIREVRRGSMAAVNGSLSRRRQRSSGLRDSPEEDGAIEMQETSRLRDRGGKKDRDRDRSGRNKRRKGDRMMHGGHRDEGEDSSEESVDEDDDDEEEDSSVVVRLPPPPVPTPTPSASVMQSHHVRKGYPVKPVRPPGTGTWKVVEEMIGAPIPRKARSSSVKRSQECWVSGGGGGSGEQLHQQTSMSPARPSPSSTAPVSPSSSNVSVRKKVKPISGPKHRPPKTSKSSSIQEIEIEVAEVLFGMTRQVPLKQEDRKHDPKESNGSGEVKSRVSSPNPISPPGTSQPSTVRPSNPSSNSILLTATAPKRKRPRMRFDEESPTSPPSATVLPATSSSSAVKLDPDVAPPTTGTKTDPASPRSEKNASPAVEKNASPAVENGGVSYDPAVSNISSAIVFPAKVQQDSVKAESISDPKDPENRPEKKAKEEVASPLKESPVNFDANIEEAPASKVVMIPDSQREKFSIDLMAPPRKLSPDIESNSDYVVESKSVEMDMAPNLEVSKTEPVNIEKKSMAEHEEIALDDKNGGKLSDSDSRKQAGKQRNLDLQLDLEKLDSDVTGAIKNQILKQQSKLRAEPKIEKGPTASLPMPMQITGWPGGFPPFGFMGQVPLPPVVPVDGCSNSSKMSFLPSQLRPKRCAAHCYIAQNIHYHQQITRLNPFWPSAAGAAPLYASKQYNLNTAPPSDSAILGSPLQGSLPGRSLGSAQEKGVSASVTHSGLSAKDKSNAAAQFMDSSQRKPPTLQPSSQAGSAGNMLAPGAFIFPLNQQQAAAAGVAAANRTGVAKVLPGSGNTAQSASGTGYAAVGASGANGSASSMSFSYPGLPPNEAQYLAFLQNNAYSFPIPAHVGGTPPYRGASPAQAMPFFNLSFYPSQMLHPSQLRLQQQPPCSQQPPYSQQGHQNPSTSSGSSSSQKNTQQSQRVPAATSAITAGNSHGFPSSKQQHLPHQVRQLESEPGGEDAPSTADSRVSQAQKNIYSQKFAVPTHSQNYALIAPAAAALSSSGGNHNEKQQQQKSQSQVMKVDLTPSQAFAMSFTSFGGAASGAAPHGLDFSSMAQNHALFQSLPEVARHGYQVSAAAAAAAHSAQQQQNKKLEDGKSVTDLGNTSTVGEEGKISSASKAVGNGQQHSLTFSRADTESPMSSILTNSVIDSCSSRTLNLIQPPPGGGGAPRISSRPAIASPVSNSATNASHAPSSQHLLQHQQQVLQLQKQHQQLQLQQQLQQQQRTKPASSHSNASVYTDRLPGNSTASKFPQGLAGFPPALIQSSASSQSAQWKASTRATNPASAAAVTGTSPSASSSVKNQMPLQQQVRSQQPTAHQPHQISFGVSPAKVAGQSGQHLAAAGSNTTSLSSAGTIAVGSPQNSVSKSSGGSPHSSSAVTKSVPPTSPVLPVSPFQKQQSGKNSSSSTISPLAATNRNMPSILGNPHITTPQNLSSKSQPSQHLQQPSQHLQQPHISKQHFPQAQFFFSNPYIQTQTSQSDAAAAAAGYFQQHQRRTSDQQQAQLRHNSTPASTGMLSLGPSSSLSLVAASGSAAFDPSKGAGTGSNSKSLTPGLLQHTAQFATISQPGSGGTAAAAAHPLMSYIHAMQSIPLKPDVSAASAAAEQKPAAGR